MTRAARLLGDVEERLAAIAELAAAAGGAEPAELEALAGCLGAERKVVQRRAAEAFAALAGRGVSVRERLVSVLTAGAPRARFGAAYALATMDDPPPETLPVLLAALGDADGDLRWAAADLLVHVPFAGLPESLRELAATGGAAQRKMALYCLRDLGAASPAAEQVALAALDDADAGVRLAAMAALPRLAGDRAAAVERLLVVLASDEPPLRRAAAAALGALATPTPAALRALDDAAAGDDPGLRRAAEGALRLLRRSAAQRG